jgi:8-oxo-dGTP diphosphatase
MDPARFPAADRPIITALRLPARYLITGPDPNDRHDFLTRLGQALAQGLRVVQLRAHELDDSAYLSLAEAALALCRRAGARLLLNRAPEVAARLEGAGVHVPAHELAGLRVRPLPPDRLVGASCHDAGELARAAALGLDYALLSPVAATASHPGSRPLGWARFAELVAPATLPVYALGGLGPADLSLAFAHGAQGVAGISGFWPRVPRR